MVKNDRPLISFSTDDLTVIESRLSAIGAEEPTPSNIDPRKLALVIVLSDAMSEART